MRELSCPVCDEVIKGGTAGRVVRCPACNTRINRDEPEEDRDDREEREERPRTRKKSRKPPRSQGGIGGLVALIVLAPVCLALMVLAFFDVRAAFAAAMGGMIFGVGAGLGMYFALQRAGRDDMIEQPSFADQFRLAVEQPKTFGTWLALECLCTVMMIEGLALTYLHEKVWKKPAVNAPQNAPAGQPPPNGPFVPPVNPVQPPPPPPDPAAVQDQEINQALADLDSPNAGVRWRAIGVLARMKPKVDRRAEVAKKLAPWVTDEDQGTRLDAIKALGVWGGPDDVPPLLRLLEHQDPSTRQKAVAALGLLRDERAIPALAKCLADSPCVSDAKQALVNIGPAAEKAVLPYVSSEFIFTRDAAFDVLKEIGTQESVPTLRALAMTYDKAREALKAINARMPKK